jgi:hypothetical protein
LTDNSAQNVDETFSDRGLNHLHLYLVKADASNQDPGVVCTSNSDVDSVQHIFCPVPVTGKYKIRVQFQKQVNEPHQPYALAWWTVPGK